MHNGKAIEGKVTLQEGDDVRIYPKEESITQSVWKVDVDARKMEATLTFAPGDGVGMYSKIWSHLINYIYKQKWRLNSFMMCHMKQ